MAIVGKHKQFPVARSQGLLTEDIDSEKVIFDEETKQAHCLTALASVVFEHCDGETAPEELAWIAGERLGEPVSREEVGDAVAQLDERGLLVSPLPLRISRREMVQKSAVFGAAAAAATLIFTVEPPMAQAATCNSGTVCSRAAQCHAGSTTCPGMQTCQCRSNTCQCH